MRTLKYSGGARLGAALALALLACAVPAGAAALTWEEVAAEAQARNPALKKARGALEQARQAYYRSYSNFLPQLSAGAGAGQSESETQGFGRSYSLGLSASLSVFSGFGDVSETRLRGLDVKIARENNGRTVSDVMYTLRNSFINLLWAQETVNLSQEILKTRTGNYEMIRLKYDAGTEDRGSLLRIEADRVQAEYDLNKARRARESASLQLVKAMGREDFAVVTVTGSLSSPGFGRVPAVDEAVRQTPEFAVAQYSLAKAGLSVTSAKSSLWPGVALSAGRSVTGPQWMPSNNQWNAGISVSYPFFPGGRNLYDIKIAETGRTVAAESFAETRQQLAVKVDGSIRNYVDAFENISVRERYLAASREQSGVTTAKYINGLTSYQDWYTIQNDFISAQRALLNARRDALVSEAQLRNVLGLGE
ncbi:MAG: TolC family protein [Endomicrobiales bacterium]